MKRFSHLFAIILVATAAMTPLCGALATAPVPMLATATPLYANHNRVPGNTQTMTNIQTWATSITNDLLSLEHGYNTLASQTDTWNTVTNMLPLDGGTLTGDLTVGGELFANGGLTIRGDAIYVSGIVIQDSEYEGQIQLGTDAFIKSYDEGSAIDFVGNDGIGTKTSRLTPDNTPVATYKCVTNIVNGMADYAVTTSVTNAVETAMTDMLGSNWRTTYGGGLAGIIAALVAALTWLKTNKLTKGMTSGVPDDPNVQSLFTSDNRSLANTMNGGTNAILQAGSNITLTQDATTGKVTVAATGGGTASGVEIVDSTLGCTWKLTCSNGEFKWVVKEA